MKRIYRAFELDLATGNFYSPIFKEKIDANTTVVTPRLEHNTQYKWRCKDVLEDGSETEWSELHYFTSSGIQWYTPIVIDNPDEEGDNTDDRMGENIDCSQLYSVLGARSEKIDGDTSVGRAYVINNSDGSIKLTLEDPNAYGSQSYDYFGGDVAINDSYVVVAARGEDPASTSGAGTVYIFDVSDGSLIYTFDNPVPENCDFGASLCISDSYFAVGAPHRTVGSDSLAGDVYIVALGTWTYIRIESPTPGYWYQFGMDIAMTNDILVVGEDNTDDGGAVHIFNPSTGAFIHTIPNENRVPIASENDHFGTVVDVSSNYIIVGAPSDGGESGEDDYLSGSAYIYKTSDFSLIKAIANPNTSGTEDYDGFGEDVAINNTYAAVGAYGENNYAGVVYMFEASTGTLLHTYEDYNDYGTPDSDYFGYTIAMSEEHMLVGAWLEDNALADKGKGYLYELP